MPRKRVWTQEELEDVRNRRLDGETLDSIGAIYGVSGSRILQITGAMGPTSYYARTKARQAVIHLGSRVEVAKLLGIDPHSVDRIRRNIVMNEEEEKWK